jgi:hypothetical protein
VTVAAFAAVAFVIAPPVVALAHGGGLGRGTRIQLPKQQQPAVGAELGAVEMELDPPIEIQPQSIAPGLTRKMSERHCHWHHPSH